VVVKAEIALVDAKTSQVLSDVSVETDMLRLCMVAVVRTLTSVSTHLAVLDSLVPTVPVALNAVAPGILKKW